MRFKSFLIITSTIVFSSAAFAQQDKADVVKQDSIKSIKPPTRAVPTDYLAERGEPVLTNKMDSKKEIFYSDAPIYVAKKDGTPSDPVAMLVLGTAKFDNNAQIVQVGVSSLTGDFVSVKDAEAADATSTKPLFPNITDGANTDGGIINFVGQWNKQKITREKRDRVSGNIVLVKDNIKVANPNSVMHFPTIKVAKEGILSLKDPLTDWPKNGVTGANLSQAEMDDFLKTRGMLEVSSNVAMGIAELDTREGNRFIVEAVSDAMDTGAGSGKTEKADFYKINSAYVDIRNRTTGGTHPGYHELNMQLYDYTPNLVEDEGTSGQYPGVIMPDQRVVLTNTHSVKIPAGSSLPNGPNVDATFMRGFTSPFNNLRADYMFYHVLTKPDAGGINSPHPDDGRRRPISDPKTKIEPGRGYFFAMDASRQYYDNIKENWHNNTNNKAWRAREKGGYNFSRLLREWKYDVINEDAILNTNTRNFNLYSATISPIVSAVAVKEEQLFNTGGVEVALALPPGSGSTGTYFYLANPFMVPISLNTLLVKNNDPITNPPVVVTAPLVGFSVPGLGAHAAYTLHKEAIDAANLVSQPLLRARYWVVNTGLLVHDYTGPGFYYYNVKYDVADLATAAGTITDALDRYIEPMQMFVVQAATGGKIIFDNSIKTFQGEPFVKELRAVNTRSTFTTDAESYVTPDWFVIQAVVEKDGGISADRTAVRFFDTATEGYDTQHDIEKKIISEEALTKARAGDNTYADENISPTNVIYTTTSAGQPLLSNGVDYSVKEIPLHYLSGSSENEKVTLSFFGMEGFENVPQGWLVDTHKNVQYELTEGLQYTFEATPEEGAITAKNRFLLKFYDDGTTGPTLTENPITCYYSGSTLHIGGLNEKDLGSKVYVYDLQGRLMGSTVINDYPGIEYRKVLGQGTFIVKIVGERNYGTKFVNLQNY